MAIALSPSDKEDCNDTLYYDDLTKYIRVSPRAFRETLKANTSISSIEVRPADEHATSEMLARCIGAMPLLRKLTIDSTSLAGLTAICFFLSNARQITTLRVLFGSCSQDIANMWDQALRRHPSLEILDLEITVDAIRTHFPFPTCLSTLPALRSVEAQCDFTGNRSQLIGFPVLGNQNIVAKQPSTLCRLSLCNLELDQTGAVNLARTLLENPNLISLDLTCPPNALFFTNLASVAKRLVYLKISVLPWPKNEEQAISSTGLGQLLKSLESSRCLRIFCVGLFFYWNAAQLKLLRLMLGETKTLETLCLTLYHCNALLQNDTWDALVSSIGRISTLKRLGITAPDGFGLDHGMKLASNYTISATGFIGSSPDVAKLWNIISTLNCHGRSYMIEDRGSKERGIALLAKIVEKPIWETEPRVVHPTDLRLDCLFFHLKENPSLC